MPLFRRIGFTVGLLAVLFAATARWDAPHQVSQPHSLAQIASDLDPAEYSD